MFDIEKTLSDFGLTVGRYEELLKDCSDKVHKVKDIDWAEISEKYNIGWNSDSIRKAQQPNLLGGVFVGEYYKWKKSQNKHKEDDKYLKEMQVMQRELEKTKKKIQTEKIEYNKWLREEARDEMIKDEIISAISKLEPLSIPTYIKPDYSNKSYLLTLADAHYGIDFKIKDLFGNIINEYNPEIFEERMWNLFYQVVDLIQKENIDTLYIWELGDGIESILRLNSQLMKLRYGIIDSTIRYANFLSEWLNELSKYVRINFQMTIDSNHCELRICNAPKSSFSEENMSKVMLTLIKERLKNNPNINIIENPTGMCYSQLTVWNCLGIHGEVKDIGKACDELSRLYNLPIDYLIAGHYHSMTQKDIGINAEVLNVRSIMGANPYSVSIRKAADAGASLFVFEQTKGKICEYSLKLN